MEGVVVATDTHHGCRREAGRCDDCRGEPGCGVDLYPVSVGLGRVNNQRFPEMVVVVGVAAFVVLVFVVNVAVAVVDDSFVTVFKR